MGSFNEPARVDDGDASGAELDRRFYADVVESPASDVLGLDNATTVASSHARCRNDHIVVTSARGRDRGEPIQRRRPTAHLC